MLNMFGSMFERKKNCITYIFAIIARLMLLQFITEIIFIAKEANWLTLLLLLLNCIFPFKDSLQLLVQYVFP